MKFKQILSAAWHTRGKELTYCIFALGEDGNVYRMSKAGWVAQPTEVLPDGYSPAKSSDDKEPW